MEKERPACGGNSSWQSSSSSHSSSFGSSSDSRRSTSQTFNYYAYLEEQINNQARKMTVDYMKGCQNKGGNNNTNNNN